MDEYLIYNTPTSEKIITDINEFQFKKIWEKNLEKNKKNLTNSIIFSILGMILIFIESIPFGTFFMGYSIASILYYFNYQSLYKKSKILYQKRIDTEIENLNKNSKDVFWEFAPEYFRFKNYKSDLKFDWGEINYQIVEEIYLYIIPMPSLNFILQKDNIDDLNFEKTLEYLKYKATLKVI